MKRFNKVYYVIQTAPRFKVCGHSFSKKFAQFVASQIQPLTGEKGHVISFTREELQKLGYTQVKR